MTTSGVERRRFVGLDGLRGLAAIVVLFHHLDQAFIPHGYFVHGYLAVDLFFLLSGFVIARSYEAKLLRGMPLKTYAKARIVRLYPMIAFGILLGVLTVPFREHAFEGLPFAVVTQLLMIPALWRAGGLYSLNPPQWSLLFEAVANVFHASIVRRLTDTLLAAVVACAAIALFGVAHHYRGLWVGFNQDGFFGGLAKVAFSFFAGISLSRLYNRGFPSRRVPWLVAASAMIVVFVGAGMVPGWWHTSIVDSVIVMLLWPAIVWACISQEPPPALANACVWLGVISYPLYAIQDPLRLLTTSGFRSLGVLPGSPVIAWIGCAIFSLMMAHMVGKHVEPRLRRGLTNLLSAAPAKEVAHAAP